MNNTTPYEEGSPESKICILAEAPARAEIRQGRPLVGPSGQLLDQSLHPAKIVRRECYLLNLFPFEVNHSKSGVITDRDGDILWTVKTGLTELGTEAAKPSFQRLSNSRANVVIPLGGTALSSVFGDSRIMKWRGSILSSNRSEISGRKLVPTVHPAACLRGQYLWRHLLISDLDRARQESNSPKLNLPKRSLLIDPSFSDVEEYLRVVKGGDETGFDIEVLNHQVSCISFSTSPKEAMSIPFVVEGGRHRWTLEQEEQIWLLIAHILGDDQILKIGQNLIFDIGFLIQQMGIHTFGPIGDTMIAHHIMFPDFPKGLDFLCSMHTREPYYKDDRKLWSKPWADLELFWRYNCKDSCTTHEMWPLFKKIMIDDGYIQCYQDTIDIFPCLLYMMIRGMAVDVERLKQTNVEVRKKIQEASDELEKVADYTFNPSSPKQCQEYFYTHKGNRPYISRSTGRPTTDDKAMSRIFRRFHYPEAKLVQELRSLNKLLGTYLEVEYDKDRRIRCSYNPRGTTTGRLSSSKTIFGTGMNLQNLDPRFKGFLIARD